MRLFLPIILILTLGCQSYSIHEQNMITQQKRMILFDTKSRSKQQYIRSSNKEKKKKIEKSKKVRRYIR